MNRPASIDRRGVLKLLTASTAAPLILRGGLEDLRDLSQA
jgi:hypothetical protein